MSESIEQHEQAEHAVEGGRKQAALLIAVLAAGLALAEQGGKHADTHLSADAIAASDIWAQYQAKSIRANQARDMAGMAATLATPDIAARDAMVAHLRADASHFETEAGSGKAALATHAHALEEARDVAHEKLEAFDNASAAFQLAIVLTTASVITGSAMLVWLGAGLGLAGVVLACLAMLAPGLAAF